MNMCVERGRRGYGIVGRFRKEIPGLGGRWRVGSALGCDDVGTEERLDGLLAWCWSFR